MSYNSLRYVDDANGNFLFRGGEAVITDPYTGNKVFDYQGLTAAIANAPNLPVTPLPTSYYLVMIDLEYGSETANILPTMQFLSTQGQGLAEIHFWETYGTDQCYFNFDAPTRQKMVATLDQWLPDPLIWRVATLRRWLETPQLPSGVSGPVVIYVHCDGGCDRTSEIIGAYRLRYMPPLWTMQNAWWNMYNEHPCSLPMGCDNYMATQWYAYWLNQTMGFSLTGIDAKLDCNNAGTPTPLCPPCSYAP